MSEHTFTDVKTYNMVATASKAIFKLPNEATRKTEITHKSVHTEKFPS